MLEKTNMEHFLLLVGTGIIGGMINAIAGGGAIIMYPALLTAGLPPLLANATVHLVVFPGSATSAYGYRQDLKKIPKSYLWLVVPSLAGAIIGAIVLTSINPGTFEQLAPWLVLSAVTLLAVQSRLHRWLSQQTKKRKIHWHASALIFAAVFVLAIYGGFFGVGLGLVMLAILGFSSLANINQINAVKNLCAVAMSGVATVYFMRKGLVNYSSGLVMAVGTAIGGFTGARLAHKVSTHLVHNLTVAIGMIIVIMLLTKS